MSGYGQAACEVNLIEVVSFSLMVRDGGGPWGWVLGLSLYDSGSCCCSSSCSGSGRVFQGWSGLVWSYD